MRNDISVYEALRENCELLARLARTGVAIEDIKHLALYEDFERLKNDGLKVTYIVAHLCDQYEMSEPTVWRIVRKFRKSVVQ